MRRTALLILLIVCVAIPASAGPKKTITVVATGDSSVDRQAIQDAIDAAGKNYTVELVGTFVLDGYALFLRKGNITIAGVEIDNDYDGAVNEDWGDGVDNDGDGAIDEDGWDAVLQGVLGPDGRPDRVPGSSEFNRGLLVEGLTTTISQVVVRGIEFSGLLRGVVLTADTTSLPTFLCSDIITTGGSIRNSTFERNNFTNTVRGFQIYGASDQINFRDNLLSGIRHPTGQTDLRSLAILLLGTRMNCRLPNGDLGSVAVGTPRHTDVRDNTIVNAERDALVASGIGDITVFRNELVNVGRYGINIADAESAHVQHNTVVDVGNTGFLIGTHDAHIQNNTVEDFGVFGFWLYSEASGNKLINNTAAGFGAMWLDPQTHNNKVRLNGKIDPADVMDFGTDNDIR